jgi:hypothetical protein
LKPLRAQNASSSCWYETAVGSNVSCTASVWPVEPVQTSSTPSAKGGRTT